MASFTVAVGEILSRFDFPPGDLGEELADRYAAFRSDGRADYHWQVHLRGPVRNPNRTEPATPTAELEGRMLKIHRHDFEATLDLDSGQGRVSTASSPFSFDSFFRVALTMLLLPRGRVMVHACGLNVDGGGILLPGLSGAGKTTLARRVGPAYAVCDELNIVSRERLWSTPFWGLFVAGRILATLPLSAIFFLNRFRERGVRPVAKAEAVARLLECVLFFSDTHSEEVFTRAAEIVRAVPAFELSYDAASSDDVIAMIRSVMRGP